MEKQDIYEKLGEHLSLLGMGYPYREDLIEILRQNYTELEAKVALAIPTKVIPLEPVGIDEIQKGIDLAREKLQETLEHLEQAIVAAKNLRSVSDMPDAPARYFHPGTAEQIMRTNLIGV